MTGDMVALTGSEVGVLLPALEARMKERAEALTSNLEAYDALISELMDLEDLALKLQEHTGDGPMKGNHNDREPLKK